MYESWLVVDWTDYPVLHFYYYKDVSSELITPLWTGEEKTFWKVLLAMYVSK